MHLKAGGSVGHTSGVINAFAENNDITLVSNDILPGVKPACILISPRHYKIPNAYQELLYNWYIRSSVPKKKYNLIYQRYSAYSFLGAYLAKKWHIPFVLEYNSSELWKMKHWNQNGKLWKKLLKKVYYPLIARPLVRAIERYNIDRASKIVVVSDVLKQFLLKQGVESSKIIVQPNAVDTDKFSPNIKGDSIREYYDIAPEQKVLGFIGTFGEWHGVLVLARAIVAFYDKHPEEIGQTQFLLIGDGILLSEVKNIISDSKYQDNVIFTGLIEQEKAPEYLAACDILLSPHVNNPDKSTFFGSPTKLFEYMAMGKGIIASAVGQIADILTDGENAILLPSGDVQLLAEKMFFLVENDNYRQKIGKNARQLVEEKYTWRIYRDNILQNVIKLQDR